MRLNIRFKREHNYEELFDSYDELQERIVGIVKDDDLPEGYDHQLFVDFRRDGKAVLFNDPDDLSEIIAYLEAAQILDATNINFWYGDSFETNDGKFTVEYNPVSDGFVLGYGTSFDDDRPIVVQEEILSGLESLCAKHGVQKHIDDLRDDEFFCIDLDLEKTYSRGDRAAAVAYVQDLQELLAKYNYKI